MPDFVGLRYHHSGTSSEVVWVPRRKKSGGMLFSWTEPKGDLKIAFHEEVPTFLLGSMVILMGEAVVSAKSIRMANAYLRAQPSDKSAALDRQLKQWQERHLPLKDVEGGLQHVPEQYRVLRQAFIEFEGIYLAFQSIQRNEDRRKKLLCSVLDDLRQQERRQVA